MSEAHQRDFAGFDIVFDHYGSTNSEANRALCHEIWDAAAPPQAWCTERDVTQLFDPEKGTVPRRPLRQGHVPALRRARPVRRLLRQVRRDLRGRRRDRPRQHALRRHARAALGGAHCSCEIEQLHEFLHGVDAGRRAPPARDRQLPRRSNFLVRALRDWDVSRPAPYFGFEIPDAPGNYWYVWFDAPIGYIASTQEWCDANGEDLDDWWRSPTTSRSTTSSGRTSSTSTPSSGPPCCKTAGFSLPRRVQVHGFLTVERREDVASRRARSCARAPTSSTSIRRTCATSTPASSARASTTSTSTSRSCARR